MDDSNDIKPDLTIVGGQPSKRRHRFEGKIKVPVGLEKALYLAANDAAFRSAFLEDWRAAVNRVGINLRPSEEAVLRTANRDMLATMIDRIEPSNPRRRKFMGLVAAAATSLAAGTAALGSGACVEVDKKDHYADAGVTGDTDADMDTDTDTDSDSDMDAGDTDVDSGDTDTIDTENPSDAGSWGILADNDFDGEI